MNSVNFLTSQSTTSALGWTLLHFVWQGILIAMMLVVAKGICRRCRPELRYGLACAALTIMVAVPFATFYWIHSLKQTSVNVAEVRRDFLTREALDRTGISGEEKAFQSERHDFMDQSPGRSLDPGQTASHRETGWAQRLYAFSDALFLWGVRIWFAGVLILSFRLIAGWSDAQGFKRQRTRFADPAWKALLERLKSRLNVRRSVLLLETAMASSPMVIGWLKPVILMPTSALMGLTPRQVEALLAHELAHIRRYDYWVNWGQLVVETVLFYHPAVWWVSKQIREEREHCCDDIAVTLCGDAVVYARALTELEARRQVPAVAASGGSLLLRIRRLLCVPDHDRSLRTTGAAAFVVASALILFGFNLPLSGNVHLEKATFLLRQMCLDRDFEHGYHIGKTLVEHYPKSAELFAWYVYALVVYRQADPQRPTTPEVAAAFAKARAWTKTQPDNGWAWFALGAGFAQDGRGFNEAPDLDHQKITHMTEADYISQRVLTLMPNNVDAYWLRADVLIALHKEAQAIAVADAYQKKFHRSAQMLTQKGIALSALSRAPEETASRVERSAAAIEALQTAMSLDSTQVIAPLALADHLTGIHREEEASFYFQKAIRLSPDACSIRRLYWTHILNAENGNQKKAEIASDVTGFLKRNSHDPGAFREAYRIFDLMDMEDAKRAMRNRILFEFPASMEAEAVLFEQIDAMISASQTHSDAFLELTRRFVARAQHYNDIYLGKVYRAYFAALAERPEASPKELVSAAQGMAQFDQTDIHSLSRCALVLSDRTDRRDLAVSIVQETLEKPFDIPIAGDTPTLRHARRDTLMAELFDALGWAYFKMGRRGAAIRELVRAQMYKDGLPLNLYHLGKAAEKDGDLVEARMLYRRGLSEDQSEGNPNRQALADLDFLTPQEVRERQ